MPVRLRLAEIYHNHFEKRQFFAQTHSRRTRNRRLRSSFAGAGEAQARAQAVSGFQSLRRWTSIYEAASSELAKYSLAARESRSTKDFL
jgi:hypothetical protein